MQTAGSGTVVYSNKDKYEGDWLNGKRHGVGALWLYDGDRYRIQYTGEWEKDKFHVSACSVLGVDIDCQKDALAPPEQCTAHTFDLCLLLMLFTVPATTYACIT